MKNTQTTGLGDDDQITEVAWILSDTGETKSAVVRLSYGRWEILSIEGKDCVTCPHCGGMRFVESFNDDTEMQAWFKDCASSITASSK